MNYYKLLVKNYIIQQNSNYTISNEKGNTCFLVLALSSKWVYSQYYEKEEREFNYPNRLYRLSLLVPGFLVEQNLNDNKTIILNIAAGLNYSYTNFNGESESTFFFTPFVRIEPRVYTNFEKRGSLGKRTDNYSGQFLAFQAKFGFKNDHVGTWQSYGPLWGFQRSLGKFGYWDIGIGYGILLTREDSDFDLLGQLGFGFILN